MPAVPGPATQPWGRVMVFDCAQLVKFARKLITGAPGELGTRRRLPVCPTWKGKCSRGRKLGSNVYREDSMNNRTLTVSCCTAKGHSELSTRLGSQNGHPGISPRKKNGGFQVLQWAHLLLSVGLLSATASGSTVYLSDIGTLGGPQDVFEATFTLAASDTITFQTWGFGGGTNAGGNVISAGGFDPLIALFSGPVATATMYVDASGNPLADADNLLNSPWSFVGHCPPAGTVAIGVNSDCGDDEMQLALSAGTYTLVLSDADYQPNAIYDNGSLSEGFLDLTGGQFQTCDARDNTCITPNGNFAVDVVSTRDLANAPEPGALSLLSVGLVTLAGFRQFTKRRTTPNTKGATQ